MASKLPLKSRSIACLAMLTALRKPEVFACGFCHRAAGPGGPENANLTGLSAAYIIQQMADFKSGARKSSSKCLTIWNNLLVEIHALVSPPMFR